MTTKQRVVFIGLKIIEIAGAIVIPYYLGLVFVMSLDGLAPEFWYDFTLIWIMGLFLVIGLAGVITLTVAMIRDILPEWIERNKEWERRITNDTTKR